jgi:septum formation protein
VVRRFILASGSPRRRQLLTEAGYEFEVVLPSNDEVSHAWLTARELTLWNAAGKARLVSETSPAAVVLAADTLVTIDGDVLGKPVDMEDAVKILRRLTGRAHEVWTAVCICDAERNRSQSFHEISRVHFHPLEEGAIRSYLAKINPLDKAGAYAAQGHGKEIIQRIEGSYSNVVGLPMETTMQVLRDFGINPTFPRPARASGKSASCR